MEVKSVVKNTGISPRKMKALVDLVRGKSVEEALTILKFTSSPHAVVVAKVIKSAAADAEKVHNLSASDLKVVKISSDEAVTLKRYKARSRHRVSPILKRSSHITVVVGEQEA
ncbi:MAG: 50S ribosomal protein L22 [Dehalococcoidales bacterium]|nr:50S ribosomal protein L22 [Dehalococcoidales bacterium]